jgi:hypothetical protein
MALYWHPSSPVMHYHRSNYHEWRLHLIHVILYKFITVNLERKINISIYLSITLVRDDMSKGSNILGQHHPRDGRSETFRLGTHCSGTHRPGIVSTPSLPFPLLSRYPPPLCLSFLSESICLRNSPLSINLSISPGTTVSHISQWPAQNFTEEQITVFSHITPGSLKKKFTENDKAIPV